MLDRNHSSVATDIRERRVVYRQDSELFALVNALRYFAEVNGPSTQAVPLAMAANKIRTSFAARRSTDVETNSQTEVTCDDSDCFGEVHLLGSAGDHLRRNMPKGSIGGCLLRYKLRGVSKAQNTHRAEVAHETARIERQFREIRRQGLQGGYLSSTDSTLGIGDVDSMVTSESSHA